MNFILFISSLLSVNAVISVPLSSVISNDTQQVEYIEYCAEDPLLILQKTPEVQLYEVLNPLNLSGANLYSDLFHDAFDLHQHSLIFVDTLISMQKYKIQLQTFQHSAVIVYLKFNKTLYQLESENLNA
ncbi:MAG: hypothetical protein ACI9YH_003266 [Colwellia sp.]|jgi:hypothetical protein